jgi:hypothetical protein
MLSDDKNTAEEFANVRREIQKLGHRIDWVVLCLIHTITAGVCFALTTCAPK